MISKIWSIAKQNAKEGLYYRFDLLLYIFNFIIEITVYVFIWLAIYNNGNQILGMSFEQVTTYYILVVSLSPIINWGINEIMGNAIREGEILRELLNPISYFSYYFGIRIGELIESTIVRNSNIWNMWMAIWSAISRGNIRFCIIYTCSMFSCNSCIFLRVNNRNDSILYKFNLGC